MIRLHSILSNFINLGTDDLIYKAVKRSKAGKASHVGQHLEIRPNKATGSAPRWVADNPQPNPHSKIRYKRKRNEETPATEGQIQATKEQPVTQTEQTVTPPAPEPAVTQPTLPEPPVTQTEAEPVTAEPENVTTQTEEEPVTQTEPEPEPAIKFHHPVPLPAPPEHLPSGKPHPSVGPRDDNLEPWFIDRFDRRFTGVTTSAGVKIAWVDHKHFPKRLKERHGTNKSDLIYRQIRNPLFLMPGSNGKKTVEPGVDPESVDSTPSTMYCKLHHSVIVIDNGVLKSFFPNNPTLQIAIKRGYRGQMYSKDPEDRTPDYVIFNKKWEQQHITPVRFVENPTIEDRRANNQILRNNARRDPSNYEMTDDDIGTYDPNNFDSEQHRFRSLYDVSAAIRRGFLTHDVREHSRKDPNFVNRDTIELPSRVSPSAIKSYNLQFLEQIDQTNPNADPANFDISMEDLENGFNPFNFNHETHARLSRNQSVRGWDSMRSRHLPQNLLRRDSR